MDGIFAIRQLAWECQKQPLTSITSRRFRMTMSGVPGQRLHVEPIPQAQMRECCTHAALKARVASTDSRHHPGSISLSERVRHGPQVSYTHSTMADVLTMPGRGVVTVSAFPTDMDSSSACKPPGSSSRRFASLVGRSGPGAAAPAAVGGPRRRPSAVGGKGFPMMPFMRLDAERRQLKVIL